ncbi:GIY-YIG nuclease family protein [Halomonas sp. ML-15]|uniref:GIY-YIG nuclease family protein n=1 Tax=Halomonas sp. ML-15 TaxID=2773305 RepID=UPI00296511AE|nr:GIY-YIG nuclease family protein [Halomonas sp. ML-15]
MSDDSSDGPVWYLYLVETAAGALYTGISTDVTRRFAEHCGGKRGARALRGKGPLTLVHQQAVGSHTEALRLEREIKRMAAPAKRAWLARRGGAQ